MSQYVEAFRKLPRAARWGLFALLAIALYFYPVEPIVIKAADYSRRADDKEKKLSDFAASTGPQKQALDTFTLGVRHFGDVEFPGDTTRQAAFNRAVNKVLDDNKITNAKSRSKSNVPLGNGPLTAKLGNDQRVERVVRDIEFDATPETVAKVIADLERIPVVATVSRVQIRTVENKDKSARLVHAAITAEAWQVGAKKG